ncbi:MAG: phosphotransferase [Gammaproteobacteria bacterium]|nr:phosphotransferase [Gammaproteobacteria bacterium]
MVTIASSPEQITPEWLTLALQESGHLPVGEVIDAEYELIGTGKMGDNARYTLTYDGDYGAPATLIAKLPASDEKARTMAGALGAYYNEVMFYKHLAPRTEMRTPAIYANEVNAEGTEFVTLMEDLAPAQPGSQLRGESLEHTRLALQQAAKLAASFYGDEEIGALDFVTASARADGGAQGGELMQQCWPQFVDRFGHGLSSECIALGERYVDRHLHFVTRYQGKKTLIHGDFRCENVLFGPDTATIVDWQTVGESSALTDAAYFMGGSVDIPQRREWERQLIGAYADWLNAAGVDLGFQDCWEQYREFAMHGILITVLGACFTEAAERSDRMFLAMIQRHLQQCVDLDSSDFLE